MSLLKETVSSDQVLTLVTSFNLNYPFEGHVCKYSHLGHLGFSILILSGTFQSITVYFLYTLFDQVEITVLKSLGKKKREREIGRLPWWSNGYESTCQCRGHGFNPWSGKISNAMGQLSPCTTTAEPAPQSPHILRAHTSQSPCSAIREATTVRSPHTRTK